MSVFSGHTLGHQILRAEHPSTWKWLSPAAKFDCFHIPEPNTGCWLWVGPVSSDGYGSLVVGGKKVAAHQYAYERYVGRVPSGLELDHRCRERSCCNPDHLEPVTHAENIRRGAHWNRGKPSCIHGHPFDEANTRINATTGKRACRACHTARAAMPHNREKQRAEARQRYAARVAK